ncbi:MAG: protoporphyrinogen oxidase, partial [Pseudomonadota bacterium]
MKDIDVLVIGGGISGLAVAHLLAREGLSVEIWEQDSQPGGKIRSNREAGYLTEQAASMVLNFRPEVSRFMQDAGLESSKTPRTMTANRYLVDAARLVALPMKLGPMMSSPLWSLRGKLRLAMEAFIPRGGGPHETVSEFITRRLGKEMLDKAMGPFVAGPLASDPDQANAFSVLPR